MSCNDFDVTIDNIIRLGEQKEEETINVIPTQENQVIYPTPNKTIGRVEVQPIPSEYVIPSGEITITEQGTFDVKKYNKAVVTAPFDRKFAQLINGTIAEVTEEDLKGCAEIKNSAFEDCTQLKEIPLPSTILKIGKYAFAGSGITSIKFPKHTNIGYRACDNCKDLKNVYFQYPAYFNGETISNCALDKVEFEEGFDDLSTLNKTFEFSNIENIILPSTILNMGLMLYYLGSTGITNLIIKAKTPPIVSAVGFLNVTQRVFVPITSKKQYESATNWSSAIGKYYPLVKSESDLSSIDTTLYNRACVIGNDLGIEDDNNYAIYNYTNGDWVKES